MWRAADKLERFRIADDLCVVQAMNRAARNGSAKIGG